MPTAPEIGGRPMAQRKQHLVEFLERFAGRQGCNGDRSRHASRIISGTAKMSARMIQVDPVASTTGG
jgi:hypothetical protein